MLSLITVPLRIVSSAAFATVAGIIGATVLECVDDRHISDTEAVTRSAAFGGTLALSWAVLFASPMHPIIRYPAFVLASVMALLGWVTAQE